MQGELFASHQLLVASHQFPVTSHWLLVNSQQLIVTSHQLLVTSRNLLVTSHQLLVANFQLLVTSLQLQVTSCQSLVTNYQSLSTSHQLRVASHQLLVLDHVLVVTGYQSKVGRDGTLLLATKIICNTQYLRNQTFFPEHLFLNVFSLTSMMNLQFLEHLFSATPPIVQAKFPKEIFQNSQQNTLYFDKFSSSGPHLD